jgi:ataxia telangiectasia mutated family protein
MIADLFYSCAFQEAAKHISVDWVRLWQIGARALIFPTTCRAAAVQIHAILAKGLVEYHSIGEDVSAIITAADTSGPVILCDSAVLLMMHILHLRITEVPGSSLTSCHHVIRWLLSRWSPGID